MAIRLGLPTQPYWIDLPGGARVFVRPLDSQVYQAAKRYGRKRLERILDAVDEVAELGGEAEGVPDLSTEEGREAFVFFWTAVRLAQKSIIQWEGVLDGKGVPAPVTPDAALELMRFHSVAETFVVKYTQAFIDRVTEGNASGPSPSGTSGEGPKPAELVH